MMDYDDPFHDVGPVINAVGGGLEERLCQEETYIFREDFEYETTRVRWDDQEVMLVQDDYNDPEEELEIFSLGEGEDTLEEFLHETSKSLN